MNIEVSNKYEELISFLLEAKRATYAGKGAEVNPSRPNSHDLWYTLGSYKYIDTYLGGEKFSGEEAVWIDGKPIWAMNYSGRLVGDGFSGDFLKEALLLGTLDLPYRGPLVYQNKDYSYHTIINGDFEWFQGVEEILYKNKKVYECVFHGGIIK